ncbi:MAG: tryptophan 7-halogenase [Pirellulaceae bacterium]
MPNTTTDSYDDQRILEVALALWSEKGYANSTLRELSRRLGISISKLYKQFPTKEHLVFRLYGQLNQQALDHFQEHLAENENKLDTGFQAFLQAKLTALEPHREAIIAIFREAIDPNSALSPLSAQAADVREANIHVLSQWLRECGIEDEANLSQIARLTWMLHLVAILYWLHDRSSNMSNTQQLVAKMAEMASLLPLLKMIPESEKWLGLLQGMIREPSSKEAAEEPSPLEAKSLKHYDVVVVGAGPIGMLYATWLKIQRPASSILVLDRNKRTTHKIGESTLSGFCKAARSVGIRHEVMQRLFFPKNGLGFFHVNTGTKELTDASEYILETFDETFQVERRVMDQLLIDNGKRQGISVIQGATVDMQQSVLEMGRSIVAFRIGQRDFRVTASLVTDASGPSRVVGRHVQEYAEDKVQFQTSAVWGYFRNVRSLDSYQWPKIAQFPRDEYTQHICFPEGWMWYIPIISWQDAPDTNLQQMIHHLLQDDNPLPGRLDLADQFGCPSSEIVSIGMVLRQDRDRHLRDDPRAAFETYRRRYPAIDQLLSGSELLHDHYESQAGFSSRSGFRRHARQVTGNGWMLIGDAAFFVDPLISPGLTSGAATAYRAVHATVQALDQPDQWQSALVGYEEFAHQLHDALERDNQLVYMSFNHPEALELVQRFQEIDARKHFCEHENNDYSLEDINVWGILDKEYQVLQKQLYGIMAAAEQQVGVEVPVQEQSAHDYEPMVQQIKHFLGSHLEEFANLTPFIQQN